MSCPRPVGALGLGTFSTALVMGGQGCLLANTWVVGGDHASWGGLDLETGHKHPCCTWGLVYNCSTLSPGGGRDLLITPCHPAYLVSTCFSFRREGFGNVAE